MSNSNIHGVGESNQSENYNAQNNSLPLYARGIYRGDPKQQSLPSYLKEVICPLFTFKSFSFVILIINLIIFILSLIPHGLEQSHLEQAFLPPSAETLYKFGSLCGTKIKESPKEAYRWIANSLLHASFEHIFANSLCILFFGTVVEILLGTLKYTIIYIISGILGSLFSVLIDETSYSVGASICCYGIMGTLLGFYILNWNALPRIFGINNKCMIILFPVMVIFTSFFIIIEGTGISGNPSAYNINVYGHLGGLIFGFLMSLFIIKPKEDTDSSCFTPKIWFYIGLISTVAFAVLGFPYFYFY